MDYSIGHLLIEMPEDDPPRCNTCQTCPSCAELNGSNDRESTSKDIERFKEEAFSLKEKLWTKIKSR